VATRIQLRRGTATQWTTANTVLEAGEIGWESNTNKFKIGDGTTEWDDLTYFLDATDTGFNSEDYILATAKNAVNGVAALDANINVVTTTGVVFEGATANNFETTLQVIDPTSDKTITLPDATGTVVLDSATQTLTNKTLTTPVISSITNGAATLTLPTSTGTIALTSDIAAGIVTESGTQTLTNKTLTSPVITGLVINDGSIIIEGSSADSFETTLAFTNPTADRTITFPNNSFTVASTDDISAATGGSVTETGTQTLTNKTLTSPTISSITNTGTLTLPTSTDTLVGRATTDTLTNKTLTSPIITGAVFNDGSIVFEGATADAHETTFAITDPTADRTITFPDATGTVALTENVAALSGATFTGAVSGTSLTLSGDLTINGTTTTINSTTLTIDDKNIVLADGNTSDASADGGGITLSGATSKTFNWVDATDAWTSSEHMNLLTGKSYKINGTTISAALPALTWGEVKDGKSGLAIS